MARKAHNVVFWRHPLRLAIFIEWGAFAAVSGFSFLPRQWRIGKSLLSGTQCELGGCPVICGLPKLSEPVGW